MRNKCMHLGVDFESVSSKMFFSVKNQEFFV